MDPDMVRQQEEAEAASRVRRPVMPSAQSPAAALREDLLALRVDFEEDNFEPAPLPVTRAGLGVVLRATFFCLMLTGSGLVGGIMLGVKLGLVAWQSLAIGSIAGLLLGWQAAAASLRGGSRVTFGQAFRAPLLPTLIILVALIASMAVAALFTDISPTAIAQGVLPSYWLIVAAGAVAGFILAAIRLRKALQT